MRIRTFLPAALLAVAGLSLSLTARAQDQTQQPAALTPKSLVGLYTITSGEKYGAPIPEDEIRGSTVRFTVDRVVVVDRDKKELYGATYTLHSDRKPCQIVLVSKLANQEDSKAEGLIERQGDQLKLIYALPGGQAPSEFKTKERQLLFVMKKAQETIEPK